VPGYKESFGVQLNAHNICQPSSASKFEPLSAEADTLDGLNIHLAIVDELHAHRTREIYDVLETGTGKRDPVAAAFDHDRGQQPRRHLLRDQDVPDEDPRSRRRLRR
jgi:methylase of polypeptide subunit release factors